MKFLKRYAYNLQWAGKLCFKAAVGLSIGIILAVLVFMLASMASSIHPLLGLLFWIVLVFVVIMALYTWAELHEEKEW